VNAELGPEIWNLGLLRGGEATNVVSSHTSADLLARTVPGTRFRGGTTERRKTPPYHL